MLQLLKYSSLREKEKTAAHGQAASGMFRGFLSKIFYEVEWIILNV